MILKNKKLKYPLIQGGMGIGVSLGNLAGSVASLGAIGIISTANPGFKEPNFWQDSLKANQKALRAEIRKAKALSQGNGLVGINAMVATIQYEEMIKVALEEGIDLIISGAGLPIKLPELTKGYDVLLAPIVSSGKATSLILRSWDKKYQVTPDIIIIEAATAGGHLGFSKAELINKTYKTAKEILQEVKEVLKDFEEKYQKKIYVFVAGLMNSRDKVKEITEQGADGVQVASRFLVSDECDLPLKTKEIYLNAKDEDVTLVKSPVGLDGRALRSPLTMKLEEVERIAPTRCSKCVLPCVPSKTPYCISDALISAALGDYQNGLFFIDEEPSKLTKILPVKKIIEELMED